ncbi:MAG: hypothetical protein KC502_02610 [Myxococcales bacterium]|nr:hypothetical protein [Myxococcales bacterium]
MKMAHLLALALSLAVVVGPSLAHGNNSRTRSDGTSDNSSRGSSTDEDTVASVLLATTLVGVVGTAFGLYRSTKNSQHQAEVAEYYLRHHAVQIRQDLSLGRGPLLRGLSKGLKLDAKRGLQFRRAVVGKRRVLLGLARPKLLTKDRALRFFWELGRLVPRKPAPKRS